MKELERNQKVSIYGNLNIKFLKKNKEESISISIENKEISRIGDVLYNFLWKQYAKFDYKWEEIEKKIETTKIVANGTLIESEKYINAYGYVEDIGGIPSEYGKKYNFYFVNIKVKELLEYLEKTYDDYIYEFDTIKEGLKFSIEKIEIL